MSKVCELTGKRPVVGHKISHSNVKSKRRFEPNLIKKKFYIPELDKTVTLKVSTKAMKTIDKLGLYAYLKKLQKKGRDIPVKL
ncbi:50S ribosomal protein L28 [Membranicola marinus]|uniref:Large ribosomal subunit protein bL28 n=1 Tax=Membranihabitans marinus TaxID=1227546 RepID=A0A953HKM1_9BACT|nr:50S ribosomal protein L28 [Membranihabitans marinus]MBY5957412.1 50S ribosomal protein L28 [Membranihabitans marinus]